MWTASWLWLTEGVTTNNVSGRDVNSFEASVTGNDDFANDSGQAFGIHDEISGILTPAGKQRLAAGEKVGIDDLRWFDDVLLLPYCTYEVHFLAGFLMNFLEA